MGARTPNPQPNPTDTVCPEPQGRSDPSERAALSLEEHRSLDGTATPFDQQKAIDTIRVLSIDAIQLANSGHPGAPMGAAPMTYALWTSCLLYTSDAADDL